MLPPQATAYSAARDDDRRGRGAEAANCRHLTAQRTRRGGGTLYGVQQPWRACRVICRGNGSAESDARRYEDNCVERQFVRPTVRPYTQQVGTPGERLLQKERLIRDVVP